MSLSAPMDANASSLERSEMTTKHGFRYKQYLLHCDPMPMADGRFGAQVTIASEEGNHHVDRRFPSLDEFDTEGEAVAYAKAWGIRWVDDRG